MRAALERLEKRHGLNRLTQRARQGVIASYVVLIALLFVGGLQLQAQSDNGLMPMLVRILPLILFLPSIVTQRPRGHAWLAFVSLLYFMQGVMIATLPDKAWLGMLEVAASLALFISSMFFARWRSRQLTAS
ncbi:DUF2069 domain-containing protein [Modicisalibacter xianhensis]|uniref:Putative membrane protein n=1 Tax=Modicisalibacter xianhensis TaxID=442341 RepID=A0A1I3CDU3_9GAMM|nr:DUF2069 domain-containing protein [Halomonas xianhensis]TDX29056.1 putative membrane protein [Halomonas xianhensis]SFH72466.1 Uncharacterized membrane protein [Halomonas xianhensis]